MLRQYMVTLNAPVCTYNILNTYVLIQFDLVLSLYYNKLPAVEVVIFCYRPWHILSSRIKTQDLFD